MKETDFLMVSLSPPEAGCIIEETLKCQMGGGGGEERAVLGSWAAAVMKHSRQLPDSSSLSPYLCRTNEHLRGLNFSSL